MEFTKGMLLLILERYFEFSCDANSNAHFQGFVPLPKSETPSRIEANAELYDFELTEEDTATLDFDSYSPTTWDPTVSPIDN